MTNSRCVDTEVYKDDDESTLRSVVSTGPINLSEYALMAAAAGEGSFSGPLTKEEIDRRRREILNVRRLHVRICYLCFYAYK